MNKNKCVILIHLSPNIDNKLCINIHTHRLLIKLTLFLPGWPHHIFISAIFAASTAAIPCFLTFNIFFVVNDMGSKKYPQKKYILYNLFLLIMQKEKRKPSDICLTPVMTAGLGFTHRSILEEKQFRSNRSEKIMRENKFQSDTTQCLKSPVQIRVKLNSA